jgi:ABC-type enterochelin transport system substrate-binding protein
METLEFIKESGKNFRIKTLKEEVDLSKIPEKIVIFETSIASYEREIDFLKSEIKELKKLL